jgi:hypothetical protein
MIVLNSVLYNNWSKVIDIVGGVIPPFSDLCNLFERNGVLEDITNTHDIREFDILFEVAYHNLYSD